jgi:hypothetical protein
MHSTEIKYLRYEVFTAVTMKNCVFWDVTPCGSCKNQRFGGTQSLLHRGGKNRELVTTLAVTDSCHPDEGGAMFPRNVSYYNSHMA